jgi:hypothetical protein
MFKTAGILIGFIASLVIIELTTMRHHASAPQAMLSECDGTLSELVIQYTAGSDPVLPVYRDFLHQLPSDVMVHAMCPDAAAFDELRAAAGGAVTCTLRPVFVGHEMTSWSRDRWIATTSNPVTLIAPRSEAGSSAWPARAGDEKVAFDLADQSGRSILAQRSDLYFDGGDLLADRDNVFVTPQVLRANLQRTVQSRDELISVLQRTTGKNVILLDESPEHHAGMFMMAVGNRTMLVGDPSLARSIWPDVKAELPGGPDFSDATQRLFDAVATRCANAGYRVVRIPTVPAAGERKAYLTYVNVITDHRDGRHVVYLPTYRGAELLNDAAAQVWRELGYQVRPVDCTSTYRLFGNLHCLVNVLRRT